MQGFVVELKVCSKETKTGVSGDREVKGDSRVREGWGIRGVRVSQSDNSVCLPPWFLGFYRFLQDEIQLLRYSITSSTLKVRGYKPKYTDLFPPG